MIASILRPPPNDRGADENGKILLCVLPQGLGSDTRWSLSQRGSVLTTGSPATKGNVRPPRDRPGAYPTRLASVRSTVFMPGGAPKGLLVLTIARHGARPATTREPWPLCGEWSGPEPGARSVA